VNGAAVKITQLQTVRIAEFPNLLYVLVHDDAGNVGLGETFYGSAAVASWVHETAAPLVIGEDPRRVEALNRVLTGYVGYQGSGAENRGRAAIDIALWDLLGQLTAQPLYQLLGGRTKDRMPIYNTCAGYQYVRQRSAQRVDNWGLPVIDAPAGPYEDLDAFLHRADELALSLLDQGVTAMKIWPFDVYAERSGGNAISRRDLDAALEPFRRIRSAAGNRMDIMVEFHGLWNRSAARQIVAALQQFDPIWYEDPIRADDIEGLAMLAADTSVPLAIGETVAGLADFRRLCERRAVGVVVVDVGWVGGVTVARKVAAVAESHGLPVAPHDCTGPVGLTVGTHLSVSLPNAMIQETVRAHYTGWYADLVEGLPVIEDGHIEVSERPGLGLHLRDEVLCRPDTTIVTSPPVS
jgi:galactonate dehydratase